MTETMIREFSLLSIKDNHFKASYEEQDTANCDTHSILYRNTIPVHEDLSEAIQRLRFHVEKIMGIYLPCIIITGYYRQNAGNSQLVTFYVRCQQEPTENECANLAVRLYIGRDEYAFIDRLLEDLSACEREAMLYIFKGKNFEHESFITFDTSDRQLLQPAA